MSEAYGQEAAPWVAAEIERLRALSYDALVALVNREEHRAMETVDGKALVLETHVFWDDRERRNLRVIVDVWDLSKIISRPIVNDDFIRAPDGTFVGE